MRWHKVVVYVPGRCGGSPILKGHRVTVENVVTSLQFDDFETYIESNRFSEWLTVDDLKVVLWYCATRQCVKDAHFCTNCTLNPQTTETREEFLAQLPEYLLEYPEETEKQWEMECNVDGWRIAAQVAKRLGVWGDEWGEGGCGTRNPDPS